MKKRLLGILLVLVALVALCVLSVSAADVDFSAGGTVNGWCQKCKANVDWKPLTEDVTTGWGKDYSEANGTHYYVAADKVKLAGGILTVAAGEELCLHLNGNTLYRGNIRAFNVSGTLSIMDHAANEGVLYAYAESTSTGGVIRLAAATGELNLYGGTLQMKTGSSTRCVSGGTVYMYKGSTFNMTGGTLADGKAENGGNLYIGENCKFTMTGGTMTGGKVTVGASSTGMGGNVFISAGATVNISNATLTKGHAQERGGNLVTTATNITLNITDSVISDGRCDKHGGNMYLNNGYITMTGCTVTGGESKGSGGNFITYVGASKAENYLKLLGCTVTDGTAGTWGGNVYVTGNSSGTGTLTLGNCTVTGGTCGNTGRNIFVADTGKLAITKDFAGEATVHFNSKHVPSPIRGGKMVGGISCEGPFTGKLYIENDAQQPELYGKTGDTALYIKAAAIKKNDGTKVWYDTNADAVAAYDGNAKYLVANQGDLALTGGDYAVDLCGADVNVTGTGSVTLMDSANADFKTYGTAAVTGVTVKNTAATQVDGNTYYMVNSGNTYSFHLLGAALTNVNIRPSSTGIYYDGTWSCDEVLKEQVASYGVAVSLVAMPDTDFDAEGSSCLYTAYGKDTLESGTTKTGVIIQDIMTGGDTAYRNNKNGRKPIHARAYVKLTDGTVVMSDTGAAESLHSAMTRLDQMVKTNNEASRKYLHDAREFYNTWKEDGMGDWEMNTIPVQPKVEDGVLNLLMVGNSYCYYYVEELYELLAENMPEGITEVNVYNVYHSGCQLHTHYQKWTDNAGYYTIYRTNKDGRVALTDEYTGTLEQALAMEEDWDYISLHGRVDTTDYTNPDNLDQYCLEIAAKAAPLLQRFNDLFPNAQLLWQRTWVSELGRVSGDVVWTEEYAQAYDAGMQFICNWMCEEFDQDKPYDLIQVNSGAAWVPVRATEGIEELLPFGGLCARLGYSSYGDNLEGYEGETANSGDGYHEGDIGGAQLLNAYTWYGTLTGNDCRETTYRPSYTRDGVTYTLSEELVKILQDASYSVVSQMPETVQPAK